MKQQQMLHTDLSMACDDFQEIRDNYLKAKKEADDLKDSMKEAGVRVAELMLKQGLDTCRHGGLVFYVKEPDDKPSIVVKEE